MTDATLVDPPPQPSANKALVTDTHEVKTSQLIDIPQETPDARQAEIMSAANHPEWYFDGARYFFKLLRFFNLLEPDRVVLSMTKVMLWAATIQTLLVISTSGNALTVAGALGMNVAAMVKHENRRKTTGMGD